MVGRSDLGRDLDAAAMSAGAYSPPRGEGALMTLRRAGCRIPLAVVGVVAVAATLAGCGSTRDTRTSDAKTDLSDHAAINPSATCKRHQDDLGPGWVLSAWGTSNSVSVGSVRAGQVVVTCSFEHDLGTPTSGASCPARSSGVAGPSAVQDRVLVVTARGSVFPLPVETHPEPSCLADSP